MVSRRESKWSHAEAVRYVPALSLDGWSFILFVVQRYRKRERGVRLSVSMYLVLCSECCSVIISHCLLGMTFVGWDWDYVWDTGMGSSCIQFLIFCQLSASKLFNLCYIGKSYCFEGQTKLRWQSCQLLHFTAGSVMSRAGLDENSNQVFNFRVPNLWRVLLFGKVLEQSVKTDTALLQLLDVIGYPKCNRNHKYYCF